MEVRIVEFPEIRVAVLELHGPPEEQHAAARKLVEWRVANGATPDRHRTFGIHYNDARTTPPADYRVDLCVEVAQAIAPNPQGLVNKTIPACRCAVARHLGSRENVSAAAYLYETWLPDSGEAPGDFPIFFHYVNVGPQARERDMITDVYLPLR